MIYRTLNERRTLDPSLHSLRFSRSAREAGWHDEAFDDDAPTGAAIVWAAGCALVAVVLLLVWVAV